MLTDSWARYSASRGSMKGYLERDYLYSNSPVPTNIAPLDNVLCGGLRAGLHILGGEPGAGKSALGLFISVMCALSGAHVEYVSLEMSRSQCIDRCLSLISVIKGGTNFKWGDIPALAERARSVAADGPGSPISNLIEASDPVALACQAFERSCSGLVMSDAAQLYDISGIENELHEARNSGLDLAVIDYLQYISADGVTSEYERVSTVSRRLNMLAVSLDIPILALASCSREGNKSSRAPDMHSFKGSGDIEYHALSAMIIGHSPKCSDLEREVHVVKNRFGSVTSPDAPIMLKFDGGHNLFELTI